MKTTTKIIAAVAATVSLAVAGAVLAHPGAGAGPGFGMGGPGWGHMGSGWGPMGGSGPGWGHMGGGWGPMGGGMGPGWGHMGGMGPGWGGPGADMTAAVGARLGDLKTVLKITAPQENAWKAYESAVTQQVTGMQQLRDQMHAQWQNTKPGATPADINALHQSMLALRQSGFEAQTTALKELYAVLTPEQQAAADRNLNVMGAWRARPR